MKSKFNFLKETLKETISIFKLKHLILIILLIFASSLPGILGYYKVNTFFDIFYFTITNNLSFTMVFLVILTIIILLSNGYDHSVHMLRYSSYQEYLKAVLKKNMILIFFILGLRLFFNIIAVSFRSGFNFTITYHELYEMPLFLYLLLYLIRESILVYLFTTFVFYLYHLFNKIVALVISFFISILGLVHFHDTIINSVLNLPLFYTDYFAPVKYANIFFEISGSILQIMIFIFLILAFEYKANNKRKDLL